MGVWLVGRVLIWVYLLLNWFTLPKRLIYGLKPYLNNWFDELEMLCEHGKTFDHFDHGFDVWNLKVFIGNVYIVLMIQNGGKTMLILCKIRVSLAV